MGSIVIDFTSALYLGMRHPSRLLPPWDRLSLGLPAALREPPGAIAVAAGLAALQGFEAASLLPSTLHLFMDLFELLAPESAGFFLDAGGYPIARRGAEWMSAKGAPLRVFPQHDPDGLRLALDRTCGRVRKPVVVTDGFCPILGEPAPLAEYLAVARRYGGTLVVDDTQALGILGEQPGPAAPYGRGGGGSLRWRNLEGPDLVVGASLAKGFGVPIAALAGSGAMIEHFSAQAASRVHCSPPSVAVIHAAEHALAVNRRHGDDLRLRLVNTVRRFQRGLAEMGLAADGGLFPVQTLRGIAGPSAVRLHQRLARWGVRTVLSRPRNGGEARLSFLISVRHSAMEIDRCMEILAAVAHGARTPMSWRPTPAEFVH
jgi:8-amino-7-oxononanoate synthase